LDNLRSLISKLRHVPDTVTILIGGMEDLARAQALLPIRESSVLSLVGTLNLSEVRELISRAALFLGPDSGPMHIAATTETPIVAYFGPTLPVHFAPWRAEAVTLEKCFTCRPCRQRKCPFKDFRCLHTISPEEVFQTVLRTARQHGPNIIPT
jgi:heptosyltransferase-1